MQTIGRHLLIDLVNLNRSTCLDGEAWIKAFVKSIEGLGIQILSKYYHVFKPPRPLGITAYVLLDSSHFSVHTYADTGEAAVDLFICTDSDLMQAFAVVREALGIKAGNISMMKQIGRFNNE